MGMRQRWEFPASQQCSRTTSSILEWQGWTRAEMKVLAPMHHLQHCQVPAECGEGRETVGERCGEGKPSLRLPAAFNAAAGHRPVLSWTMEKRMRLDECTFWMRGPPETDDFCPGQEGRQGERADESLTSAAGTTRPWVLSPTNPSISPPCTWPVTPGAVLARPTPASQLQLLF